MKIYIASDHGGYRLKKTLSEYLRSSGHEIVDIGNVSYDPNDDYPDFAVPLAEKVVWDQGSFGVVIGRSGNGEAIIANKVRGARAALCVNPEMAKKAREDNNANILALGADFVSAPAAEQIVAKFLETPFSEAERHARRISKVTSYETGVKQS